MEILTLYHTSFQKIRQPDICADRANDHFYSFDALP